jgi:hypothetical protein
MANVIDELVVAIKVDPKGVQPQAKAALQNISNVQKQAAAQGTQIARQPLMQLNNFMGRYNKQLSGVHQNLSQVGAQSRRTGQSVYAGAVYGARGLRQLAGSATVAYGAIKTVQGTIDKLGASLTTTSRTARAAWASGMDPQRLGAIAKYFRVVSNVPEEQTESIIQNFTQEIEAYRQGISENPTAVTRLAQFAGIGDITQLSTEQVMRQIATVLSKEGTNGQLGQMLATQFGFGPLGYGLARGPEAFDKGVQQQMQNTLGPQQTKDLLELEQAVRQTQVAFDHLFASILASASPALTPLMKTFATFIEDNKGSIADFVRELTTALANMDWSKVAQGIKDIGAALRDLVTWLTAANEAGGGKGGAGGGGSRLLWWWKFLNSTPGEGAGMVGDYLKEQFNPRGPQATAPLPEAPAGGGGGGGGGAGPARRVSYTPGGGGGGGALPGSVPQPGSPAYDNLIGGMIQQESGGNPSAENPSGAAGLMQLMPGTAGEMGVKDTKDPAQNVRGGTAYFNRMLKQFGNVKDALVAYNWGPGNAQKWIAGGRNDGELPEETRNYLTNVMRYQQSGHGAAQAAKWGHLWRDKAAGAMPASGGMMPASGFAGATDPGIIRPGMELPGRGQMDAVSGMIVHHTGGRATPEGIAKILRDKRLSAQYIIDREGNVYRTMPEGQIAHHMQTGSGPMGMGRSNKNMEGVEIIAADDKDVLPVQVQAALRLIAERAAKHGYDPKKDVFGHGEVNPGHRQITEGMSTVNLARQGQADPALVAPAAAATRSIATQAEVVRNAAGPPGGPTSNDNSIANDVNVGDIHIHGANTGNGYAVGSAITEQIKRDMQMSRDNTGLRG